MPRELSRVYGAYAKPVLVSINYAAELIPGCELLFSGHYEQMAAVLETIHRAGHQRPITHSTTNWPEGKTNFERDPETGRMLYLARAPGPGRVDKSKFPSVDHWWPPTYWGGSSSLFTAARCVDLGFDRVILCGVPLDGTGSHWRAAEHPEDDHVAYNTRDYPAMVRFQKAWSEHYQHLHGRVFSMSGFTRELLGAPI